MSNSKGDEALQQRRPFINISAAHRYNHTAIHPLV